MFPCTSPNETHCFSLCGEWPKEWHSVSTESDVKEEVTFGLFWAGPWDYDPADASYTTGVLTQEFELSDALSVTEPKMDCNDFPTFSASPSSHRGYQQILSGYTRMSQALICSPIHSAPLGLTLQT